MAAACGERSPSSKARCPRPVQGYGSWPTDDCSSCRYDDETITTGALMAGYVKQGVQVTLVTCTLGEEGRFCSRTPSTWHRTTRTAWANTGSLELSEAMQVLGVTDWRLLGEPHKYPRQRHDGHGLQTTVRTVSGGPICSRRPPIWWR